MDEFHVLEHHCGKSAEIGIIYNEETESIETYAICEDCDEQILICEGFWKDPRFMSLMQGDRPGNA